MLNWASTTMRRWRIRRELGRGKKRKKEKKTLSRATNTTAQGYFFYSYIFKRFLKWTLVTKQREYLVNSVEKYLRPVSSDYTDFIRDRVEQHRAKELNFTPSDYGKITFLLGFVSLNSEKQPQNYLHDMTDNITLRSKMCNVEFGGHGSNVIIYKKYGNRRYFPSRCLTLSRRHSQRPYMCYRSKCALSMNNLLASRIVILRKHANW